MNVAEVMRAFTTVAWLAALAVIVLAGPSLTRKRSTTGAQVAPIGETEMVRSGIEEDVL